MNGTLINKGTDLTFKLQTTSKLFISSGPLSYVYRLHQIKCHFGGNNDYGSEHSVDGKQLAAEVIISEHSVDGKQLATEVIISEHSVDSKQLAAEVIISEHSVDGKQLATEVIIFIC